MSSPDSSSLAGASPKQAYSVGENTWSGYDLGTFNGRLKYFTEVTSPLKCFNSEATIKQYLSDVTAVNKKADSKGMVYMT